ncbi:MAG: hypothetical protein L0331_18530, partial [Chloroflexi bacterium]|nr:hypothetical protein [Chloroflexota bacterium]
MFRLPRPVISLNPIHAARSIRSNSPTATQHLRRLSYADYTPNSLVDHQTPAAPARPFTLGATRP